MIDDDGFIKMCEELGLTEEKLIEKMISEGWTHGRSVDGGNEFWPPVSLEVT